MSLYMSGHVIAARRFSDNMNKISGFDQIGQQEDAQEFFQGLLNNLDTACEGDDQTRETVFKQIFGGRLRSKWRRRHDTITLVSLSGTVSRVYFLQFTVPVIVATTNNNSKKKMENLFEKNRKIIEDGNLGMEPGLSPGPCTIQCVSLDDNYVKDSSANQQTDQHNGSSNSGGVGGEGEKQMIPPKTSSNDQPAFIFPMCVHHGSPNIYDVKGVVADKDSENQKGTM